MLEPGRKAAFILEAHPICPVGNPRVAEALGAGAPRPLVQTLMPEPGLIQQLLRAPWCTQNMSVQLFCKSNSLEMSHETFPALAVWVLRLRPLKLVSRKEAGE